MKKHITTLVIILSGFQLFAQNEKQQYIGMNLLQLPASTLNLNYSIDYTPYLTPLVDLGYAFNYQSGIDVIGYILTSHIDSYNGYLLEKQSGGYLKAGTYFNLRKTFEKQNFFHLGVFLSNAWAHEEGSYYPDRNTGGDEIATVEHTVSIFGLSGALGYEFQLGKRFKASADFQVSLPTGAVDDLYSYDRFIPGMGYNESDGNIFMMLLFNLKYRL